MPRSESNYLLSALIPRGNCGFFKPGPTPYLEKVPTVGVASYLQVLDLTLQSDKF